MSHIRRNLQTAIQFEVTLEMDEYLKRNEEKIRKSAFKNKILALANDPNCNDIILQNQKNGAMYTQNAIRQSTFCETPNVDTVVAYSIPQ
jgi:hypothetical protein